MEDKKKTPKKRHYDTKLPCPGCGERIGFVQSTCPFCDERISFTSDKAGKVLFRFGCFLAVGYLCSIIYFWEEPYLLQALSIILVGIGIVIAAADRVTRYYFFLLEKLA